MNIWKILLNFGTMCLILSIISCNDYLDKTPEAEITDEQIFGSFESFQGYAETMYSELVDYNKHALVASLNLGGEVISTIKWSTGYLSSTGDYRAIIAESASGIYRDVDDGWNPEFNSSSGIWTSSWRGIRTANMCLEKLYLLNDTQEGKDLIKGQALFFRAFFHFEIIRSFGGMPYIDKVLPASDDMRYPRLSYQEITERIVDDFKESAELLPIDWDYTEKGGQFSGGNTGRITKGAALAFMAKALLYAGSPLMNKFSGNSYTPNIDYMRRAAEAAYEVIKLANMGVYELTPWANYRDMFAKNDGTIPWTKETILIKTRPHSFNSGSSAMTGRHGRLFSPVRFGGNSNNETVNQIFVDKFEMIDGSIYKTEYDNDHSKRWENRDPRFRQNILVDRDKWGFHNSTVLELYLNGIDRQPSAGILTPYIVKKFWPIGVNSYDKLWDSYIYVTPLMRLADVYLMYAEAVNEVYGANGSITQASMTAVDAVNVVRLRAGMPIVNADAIGYKSFRDLIQNERWVEFCFEGHYWFDSRRWHYAHLPELLPYIDLQFDREWTVFNRKQIFSRVCEDPKHYWMPLPHEQTLIYEGFYQNPGW